MSDDDMITRNPAPHAAAAQGPSGRYRKYVTSVAGPDLAERLALSERRLTAARALVGKLEAHGADQRQRGSYTAGWAYSDAASRLRAVLEGE